MSSVSTADLTATRTIDTVAGESAMPEGLEEEQ